MRAKRWGVALAVITAGATLTGSALGAPAQDARSVAATKPKLPVWVVTGPAVTPAAADALMTALGTFENGLQPDGTIQYLDPATFLALPSEPTGEEGKDESGLPVETEAVDLDAVREITVLDADTAIELTEGALADAVLEPLNGAARVQRIARVSNSTFDAVLARGEEQLSVPIDTVVTYDVLLGTKGIPLHGPGAEVRFSFDGDGVATSVRYAHRHLRQGQNVVIITPAQANKLAAAEYRSQCGQTALRSLQLTSQMAYYAPALEADDAVKRIMPVYEFTGRGQVGQESVDLRQIIVPAAQSVVRARISASADGSFVSARGLATGGAPPYSFQWESCSTPLDPAAAQKQSIGYDVAGREGLRSETVILHVTDANGMTASARATVPLPRRSEQAVGGPRNLTAIGPIDVGAESVGTSQGLGGCNPDIGGFRTRMALGGIPTQFFWTNLAAWEQDFKDPSKPGGDDTHYADDVDATMYCGHANGDGFTFPGAHTDGFLHHTDAFWGNRDLEWLGIAACGPLQSMSSGLAWWQRWQPAFGGLHLLLGYETVSFDVTGEGWDWANYMLAGWTVRQSWVQMAINQQPSSVRWAVMGVFGQGNAWNWNDHFWGKGSVGPDIFPGQITGSWKISGPA